jgi:uncharacterized protein YPO0396
MAVVTELRESSTAVPAAQPGFRLERVEVRNWGTFDGRVHVLDPRGQTALLIGENGSGKSTLADALVTLLVPNAKRTYNLASGAAKKKERDEETYVLGAYGSEGNTEETRAQIKFLRKPGGEPSVLLAVFKNTAAGECVSISQILWIQDGQVKKLFLIARNERSIIRDLSGLGDSRTWKKQLRERGFSVEDSFSTYAEKLVPWLRMRSPTTLTLFNQTVAIKEIINVSGFIREHMLERFDAKEHIERLEKHYRDLNECWFAIQRAKKQLEVLAPIATKAAEIETIDATLTTDNNFERHLDALFADRLKTLLEAAIASLTESILSLTNEIESLKARHETLAKTCFGLQQAIDEDEIGRQLSVIEKELEELKDTERNRREQSRQYHATLRNLGVHEEIVRAADFEARRKWAEQERQAQGKAESDAREDVARLGQQFAKQNGELEELAAELTSLRRRPDLIPEEHRRMRTRIAEGAGVDPADLPFAGELMQVRGRFAVQWRGALERLLRSFGLSMLVPERLYSRVNRFINDNHLRGRVTYHHVPDEQAITQMRVEVGRVPEKMEVKQDHPLAGWIEEELRQRFNYRCCETLADFEAASGFVITRQGLIRRAGTLHIKDDTRAVDDPRTFILGWSNADKIRSLEEEQQQLQQALQELGQQLANAQGRVREASERARFALDVSSFRSFSEIDFRSSSARREELEKQKKELEKSSDKINELRRQLQEAEEERKAADRDRGIKEGERGAADRECQGHIKRLAAEEAALAAASPAELTELGPVLVRFLREQEVSVRNADELRARVERLLSAERAELTKERGKHVTALMRQMDKFLGEFPELRSDLSPGEEFIGDFLSFKAGVEHDDLPKHEARFRDLMSREVLTHVAMFQENLEDHCKEIQARILDLNTALRAIDYSPRSFIKICSAQTQDVDVRTFRSQLKGCLAYGLAPDDRAREMAFQRISALLADLREKAEWTKKVTDTRNWLSFAVEELERSTSNQLNYYTDTGGKSGGQKAKLAFTILASAIAYQYGIAQDRDAVNSFRLVVVDEMFSRSDETNSKYALDLFTKLNLQLLIVSPFDARGRIVEPFVSSYHVAVNPTEMSSSVRTVRAEEVRERLAKLKDETPPNADA